MPFLRKYNTLLVTGTTSIRIPIIKRGVVDFAVGADWTPAAGDVKVFVDGAAVANITNLPTAIASGNTAQWEFILTAAELSCKQILVMIADAATKAIEDQSFIVETYGNASAMYAADLSLANLPANVTQWLGTACATPTTNGVPEVDVTHVAGTAQTAGDIAALITTVDTVVDSILVDTAEIGAAGAGLTSVAIGTGGITNLSFAAGAIDAAAAAADFTTEITAGIRIKKNTALANFMFLMVGSTDHVTPKTGLTITATRSIDGAAFAACANAAVEVANGYYKINLANTDLNGDVIAFKFTGGATADDRLLTIITTV